MKHRSLIDEPTTRVSQVEEKSIVPTFALNPHTHGHTNTHICCAPHVSNGRRLENAFTWKSGVYITRVARDERASEHPKRMGAQIFVQIDDDGVRNVCNYFRACTIVYTTHTYSHRAVTAVNGPGFSVYLPGVFALYAGRHTTRSSDSPDSSISAYLFAVCCLRERRSFRAQTHMDRHSAMRDKHTRVVCVCVSLVTRDGAPPNWMA